ncbi:MAG: YihY/virulence factor BrkB family protein [Candidatus Cloacimonadales bacterium]
MLKQTFTFIEKIWKKIHRDGILKESAALTYVTLLGSLPFAIFLLFFLPELPFLQLNDKLAEIIRSSFLPSSAEIIYTHLQQLASKRIPFNLFSFAILLISSYSLFQIINSSFDKILNADEFHSKNFFSNLIKFFGMTILGSLLILVLLSTTSLPFLSSFFEIPFLEGLLLYLSPVIILFMIFTFGFFYIPTVKVKIRSIIIGAATASITWIIFKSLFNWFIVHLTNIELVWGVLASVPIFLFWIYSNWVIILSGVAIVSILEKRDNLSSSQIPQQNLRVIIEKSMGEESEQLSSTTILNKDDVKEILKDIFVGTGFANLQESEDERK